MAGEREAMYIDSHVDHREVRVSFFPNEVAIICEEVRPDGGLKVGVTLNRERATRLYNDLALWLGSPPKP